MQRVLGDKYVPYGFGETTLAEIETASAKDHEEWY
jgi:hypothetical protein